MSRAQNACCCFVRGLRGVAVVAAVRAQNACCCLVRGLRGVAVVAAVVHGGMVTTVGLAGWSWRYWYGAGEIFFLEIFALIYCKKWKN